MAIRAIKNNNPLNIRRTSDHWKGMSTFQPDREFVSFNSVEYGFRAAFRIIHNGFKASPPRNTIRLIVSRWAPPVENNTDRYISFVSSFVALPPSAYLDYYCKGLMVSLVRAMAYFESGTWFSSDVIESAYEMEKT